MPDDIKQTTEATGFCPECFEGFGAHHEPSCSKFRLTKREVAAMREFRRLIAKGYCMGRKRIVSMQGLERAGLVKRVTCFGVIADWQLTPAGEAWNA